jgi:hypothetical protein
MIDNGLAYPTMHEVLSVYGIELFTACIPLFLMSYDKPFF